MSKKYPKSAEKYIRDLIIFGAKNNQDPYFWSHYV